MCIQFHEADVMLTLLSSLLMVLHVSDQCIFYQKVLPWIQCSGVLMARLAAVPSTKSTDLFVLIAMK